MGMLRDLVNDHSSASPDEAQTLASVISTACHVDGRVAPEEIANARALFQLVPQLRENPRAARPPVNDRAELLALAGKLGDMKLRRQCFVVAVEIALSADGIHDEEDAFIDELRKALRIDDAFARQTVLVLATKYGCIK